MSEPKSMAVQPPSVEGGAVQLRNVQDLMTFAQQMAASDLVPKDYRGKADNVCAAIQYGAEIGLPPMQALQNIAVVNGRPALWGDALLAVCQSHPAYEDHEETVEGRGDAMVATCTFYRKGKRPVSASFGVDDAKSAGLWKKGGPWTQYPRRMLQLRARGFAARDAFADALKGLVIREEALDTPSEPRDVTPKPVRGNDDMRRSTPPPKRETEPEHEVLMSGSEVHKVLSAIGMNEVERRNCIRHWTGQESAANVPVAKWTDIKADAERYVRDRDAESADINRAADADEDAFEAAVPAGGE